MLYSYFDYPSDFIILFTNSTYFNMLNIKYKIKLSLIQMKQSKFNGASREV